MPGDRLICAFVNSLDSGADFSRWPLHITIVPWFRLEMPSDTLATELLEQLASVREFTVEVGGLANFGRNGRKHARLVKLPSRVQMLEQIVRRYLHSHNAWIIDETTKERRTYRPHITLQDASQDLVEQSFVCQDLYIVEQVGVYKHVASKVPLHYGS